MKTMIRYAALALVLVLTLAMLSGCATNKSPEETYAATAWKVCGRADRPALVGCVHYTTPEALTSRLSMPEESAIVVPNCGYAYVFAPSVLGSYDGLCVVFVDENGEVISTMDYSAMYLIYSALGDENSAQKAAYLNACNYMAFMYAEVLENGAPITADAKTNQWGIFSEEQLKKIIR